jgi:hypothetical protein
MNIAGNINSKYLSNRLQNLAKRYVTIMFVVAEYNLIYLTHFQNAVIVLIKKVLLTENGDMKRCQRTHRTPAEKYVQSVVRNKNYPSSYQTMIIWRKRVKPVVRRTKFKIKKETENIEIY